MINKSHRLYIMESNLINYKIVRRDLCELNKSPSVLNSQQYTQYKTFQLETSVINSKQINSQLTPSGRQIVYNMELDVSGNPTFVLCNNTQARVNRMPLLYSQFLPRPLRPVLTVNRCSVCDSGDPPPDLLVPIVNRFVQGKYPFVGSIELSNVSLDHLVTASFLVRSKPGSRIPPSQQITASYTKENLDYRGLIFDLSNSIVVPVFGLYDDYTNTVDVTIRYNYNNTSYTKTHVFQTTAFSSINGYDSRLTNPTKLVNNTNVSLSFSYFLMKSILTVSPFIVDIDSEVRWVNTENGQVPSTAFTNNCVYKASGTTLYRCHMDGTVETVATYSTVSFDPDTFAYLPNGGGSSFTLSNINHHNLGVTPYNTLLLEVDTNVHIECTILEVNSTTGAILRVWPIAEILTKLLGEISSWTYGDWFHNNSACIWESRREIVVSSRENFVIAFDYDTPHNLKWILGDTTKYWYQTFAGLRPYTLSLSTTTNFSSATGEPSYAPIGQHGLSIVKDGGVEMLSLFNNGWNSANQPNASHPGIQNTYSYPMRYVINETNKTAQLVWYYANAQPYYSQIVSSVYKLNPTDKSCLVNYGYVVNNDLNSPILVGVTDDNAGNHNVAFAFQYTNRMNPVVGWNAIPISQQLEYTGHQL